MRMSWAFTSVANRSIDLIDSIDAEFLSKISKQTESCLDEYRCGWRTIEKKAMDSVTLHIEQYSLDPRFQQLQLAEISKVVLNVEDEKLPDNFSGPQQERFRLQVSESENGSVVALLQVGHAYPYAFRLNSKRAGIFNFVVQAENQKGDLQAALAGCSACVSDESYRTIFANQLERDKFFAGPGLQGLKVGFKAGMTRLHRQAFALTCYACKKMGMSFSADSPGDHCQSEQLLSALAYFDALTLKSDDSESARALLPLMEEYVARAFDAIKHSKSWGLLSPQLVSRILAKNCLSARKEADVLGFAARYCMAAAARIPAGTPVLLTCSDSDAQAPCSGVDPLARALAHTDLDLVRLSGVSHVLRDDPTDSIANYAKKAPLSPQLTDALTTFIAK